MYSYPTYIAANGAALPVALLHIYSTGYIESISIIEEE